MTFRIRDAQAARLRADRISAALAERLETAGSKTTYQETTGVLRATDAVGRTTQYRFGSTGYVETIATPAGRTIQLKNDSDGRLAAIVEPSGRTTQLQYASSGAPSHFTRDGQDLCLQEVSPVGDHVNVSFWDGSSASAHFNAQGNPVELKDRLGRTDRFSYDEEGRLIAVTNGAEQLTRFEYDSFGRLAMSVSPDGRTERYQFDSSGKLSEIEAEGQPILKVTPGPTGLPGRVAYADGNTYEFAYDESNRLTSAKSSRTSSSYEYDSAGRLIREDNDGNIFSFRHDATGLLTSIEYPDGSRVSFGYDPDKRVSSVTDWSGATTQVEYDRSDKERTTVLANGLSITERLAPSGRPTLTRVANALRGVVVFQTEATFDIQGRLTALVDSDFGTRRYAYDSESQLIQAGGGKHLASEAFEYDAAGNRTICSGIAASYTPANHLILQGGTSCAHDERGNLRTLSEGGRTLEFEYNLRNELIRASSPEGTTVFEYDALGRRISKQSPQRRIRYVWCGEQLAREIVETTQGTETRDYLYLPGSSTPFAMRRGHQCYYFHNDHRGAPERLTDQQGQVIWTAQYEAFGRAHVVHATIENPLRLPGQYYDEETGLHYNRFRYYSPQLGRYTSADAIGLLGGPNLYTYCGNDPINRSDPQGLWWKAAVSILAGVAVAAAVVLTAPVSVPALAVAAGAAALGLGVALGVDKALNIDHFCVPCAAKAFGVGLLEGAVIGGLLVLAGPEVAAVGAVVGCYAMLAEHFGWPFPGGDGIAFDKKTDEQKSASLGGLVGNLVGGLLAGLGLGGKGAGKSGESGEGGGESGEGGGESGEGGGESGEGGGESGEGGGESGEGGGESGEGGGEEPVAGETNATKVGKQVHKARADSRRASGDYDDVNTPMKDENGEPIKVPHRVDLETGEPVGDKVQTAQPDAVNYERGEIVDDKPAGRPIAKDRQEMIRFIKAYEQKTGKPPDKIIIERYDPKTGQPAGTETYTPSDFLPPED